jgi:predicted DNA-binding protein (MmcQ/YjbR family)
MATAQAALRQMRAICLSLPETGEAEHFGQHCFHVGGRLFALCGEKAGACRLVFQLEPEHASRLLASDARFAAYGGQGGYVWIDAAGVEDFAEIRPLALESYRLNAAPRPATKAPARPKRGRRGGGATGRGD